MTAIVTRGNAADLHLPDECVDLIVTSPPYFGLRSYQDGGVHYSGQVGDEATPTEYLDALIACTAEWVRVLKPGGSIFVNLGDVFSKGQRFDRGFTVPAKSLLGTPWRYAIRCIDELGLILRAEVVWSKPNGLPESVTDRVRRSHEQVFHLTKQPRYFAAVDEVREGYEPDSLARRIKYGQSARGGGYATGDRNDANRGGPMGFADGANANPLGKLPGSVWSIPTAPLTVPEHLGVDHFAAYPPELVRRIVLGWSPREVCTACGEGRRPVSERGEKIEQRGKVNYYGPQPVSADSTLGQVHVRVVTGYACACPDTTAPATSGVVLDPFGGTGTTALVASCYGRVGISVDLSADYCRLARWRTTDPGERARVLGVPKPDPIPEGQLGMFEGLA